MSPVTGFALLAWVALRTQRRRTARLGRTGFDRYVNPTGWDYAIGALVMVVALSLFVCMIWL